MEQYAVIDPNWGEPVPVGATISDCKEQSIHIAVNLKEHSLYSGLAIMPAKDRWLNMQKHGYSVKRVKVEILDV